MSIRPAGPPPSQDEFYIGSVDDVDNSHLSLYSFHVTTWNPPVASMTGSPNTQLVAVASYSGSCSGSFGGDLRSAAWAPAPSWIPWAIA